MALTKYTFFTNVATGQASNPAAIRVGGWSFTLYDDNRLTANNKRLFLDVCAAYATLLPTSGVVVAQRYQELDPLGPSAVELQRFPGASGLDADYPSLALYCRVAGTGVANTRPLYIRGLPDDVVKFGEFVPSGPYRNALNIFTGLLEGWNFKARNKSVVNAPVYSISGTGEVITEVPLTGVAVGSLVRLLRVQAFDTRVQLKKVYKVLSVANASSFVLQGWPAGEESDSGSVRLDSYIYPNIPANATTVGRVVSKKPGKPFDLFRGRASKHR